MKNFQKVMIVFISLLAFMVNTGLVQKTGKSAPGIKRLLWEAHSWVKDSEIVPGLPTGAKQ